MLKFLFLYTELADYFLSCVSALVQEHQTEVHIVRWPVNKEAPFEFKKVEGIYIYDKEDYSRQDLIKLSHRLHPNLIFCSGWLDKDYLAVARSFKRTVPVLLGFDNHWFGTPKQYLGLFLAPFTLKRIFTHAIVAGSPQALYASKLLFAPEKIIQGLYAANVPIFHLQYKQHLQAKSNAFPKRFIYVGRYVPNKGLDVLWQAFKELQVEEPNEWELWCLGTGPLQQEAIRHPKIKHFGFVQPEQLTKFIKDAGVFVLPSYFEPWGVVVHEFAAAGFPLVCSDKVGAATAYLQDNVNGYTFKASDVNSLKSAFKKIVANSDQALLEMGKRSAELALHNSPSIWAEKLMNLAIESSDNDISL